MSDDQLTYVIVYTVDGDSLILYKEVADHFGLSNGSRLSYENLEAVIMANSRFGIDYCQRKLKEMGVELPPSKESPKESPKEST